MTCCASEVCPRSADSGRDVRDQGLQVLAVDKSYPTRSGNLQALAQINLSVPPGEFVCAIGPSGCGQTTLHLILAGLQTATSGEVLVDGKPIARTDPSRVLLFQEAALFPWLTVQDNVEFGLRMKGASTAARRATAERLLEMVHLAPFADAWVHELRAG